MNNMIETIRNEKGIVRAVTCANETPESRVMTSIFEAFKEFYSSNLVAYPETDKEEAEQCRR